MISLYIILSLYTLWIFYLAVMSLYRAKKENKLTKVSLILGYPILIIGATLDLLINVIIFSIIFLETPKELLLTHRLSRHIKKSNGYRFKLAKWICSNLLDNFDPNHEGHCR